MQQVANHQDSLVYDKEELKGFARSMAELQWLLLILVILYFFIPTRPITDSDSLIITMVSYFAFVIVFRYLNFQARESHWKLAVETWAMIAFMASLSPMRVTPRCSRSLRKVFS